MALAAPVAAQTAWSVDAAGGGDFADLQAALDAVAPGDVLLVLSGSYGAAVVSQSVSILGDPDQPRPVLPSLDVQGASGVTLLHLQPGALRLEDISGTVIVDDCLVDQGVWSGAELGSTFPVSGCADVRVNRTTVVGGALFSQGAVGMLVHAGSSVQLIDCVIEGGPGVADDFVGGDSGAGGTALDVRDSSVWLTDTDVRGGNGEDFVSGLFGFYMDGYGGDGIYAANSFIDARGRRTTWIEAGRQNLLSSGFGDGDAVRCSALAAPSTVELSGVQIAGDTSACAQELALERPFLRPLGVDGPGLPRRAKFYGTAGALGLLVTSLRTDVAALPELQHSLLWVALDQALPLLSGELTGFFTPLNFVWTQPQTPALAGVELHLQGIQVDPAGALEGTHAAAFVLSF